MARDLLILKGLVKAKPRAIFKNSEKCVFPIQTGCI